MRHITTPFASYYKKDGAEYIKCMQYYFGQLWIQMKSVDPKKHS